MRSIVPGFHSGRSLDVGVSLMGGGSASPPMTMSSRPSLPPVAADGLPAEHFAEDRHGPAGTTWPAARLPTTLALFAVEEPGGRGGPRWLVSGRRARSEAE
nr:hypothetical protein KPHV_87130 [Kitasatospora purpeofusca]